MFAIELEITETALAEIGCGITTDAGSEEGARNTASGENVKIRGESSDDHGTVLIETTSPTPRPRLNSALSLSLSLLCVTTEIVSKTRTRLHVDWDSVEQAQGKLRYEFHVDVVCCVQSLSNKGHWVCVDVVLNSLMSLHPLELDHVLLLS